MPATILVVEDESIVAQDLQATLEHLGYRAPEIADSGSLALQKAAEINPDLALVDIRLIGEVDGIEAATELEKFDIPVVYVTAYADEETLARAKATAPYGYIIKPFEERELRTTIEIALGKHQSARQRKESEQWLTNILNSMGDGVIVTDPNGRITLMNPVAALLTGWSLAEASGRDITEVFHIIHETTRQTVRSPITEALATRQVVSLPKKTLLVRKDGRELPIGDSAAPLGNLSAGSLTNLGDIGAVLIFRDVTEQNRIEQKLHRQAFYDPLTNLANRAWLNERLTDAIERGKRHPDYLFAVLFLDLDGFKEINDRFGHLVGDRLLVSVASRLKQSVRPHDTAARFGGDEFAVLLEDIKNAKAACKVARRIGQQLSAPYHLDYELFTSTSIGIAISSPEYEGGEALLRDADIAMYRAKMKGKGRYEVFAPAMGDRF